MLLHPLSADPHAMPSCRVLGWQSPLLQSPHLILVTSETARTSVSQVFWRRTGFSESSLGCIQTGVTLSIEKQVWTIKRYTVRVPEALWNYSLGAWLLLVLPHSAVIAAGQWHSVLHVSNWHRAWLLSTDLEAGGQSKGQLTGFFPEFLSQLPDHLLLEVSSHSLPSLWYLPATSST